MKGLSRVEIIRADISAGVPSFSGAGAAMALRSTKGNDVEIFTSRADFLRKATSNGVLAADDSPEMFVAYDFLGTSSPLYGFRVKTNSTLGGGIPSAPATLLIPTIDPTDTGVLVATSSNDGVWGNNTHIRIVQRDAVYSAVGQPVVYGRDLYPELSSIDDALGNPFMVEVYYQPVAPVPQGDGRITDLPVTTPMMCSLEAGVTDGYGVNIYVGEVNRRNTFITLSLSGILPAVIATPLFSTAVVSLSGGNNGSTPSDGDIVTALQAARDQELYPFFQLIDGGISSMAVKREIIDIAQFRADCEAIITTSPLDNNAADPVTAIRTFLSGPDPLLSLNRSTEFGSICGPNIEFYDAGNDRYISISPTGRVAAQTLSVVNSQGYYTAVAGSTNGKLAVAGVSTTWDPVTRGLLYDLGVNTIAIRNGSIELEGQKTLLKVPSDLQSRNIALFATYLESRMRPYLDTFRMQQNSDITRGRLVAGVTKFLDQFIGTGITEFEVISDDSNNSGTDVGNGILTVFVLIKFIKAAEVIRMKVGVVGQTISLSLARQAL